MNKLICSDIPRMNSDEAVAFLFNNKITVRIYIQKVKLEALVTVHKSNDAQGAISGAPKGYKQIFIVIRL